MGCAREERTEVPFGVNATAGSVQVTPANQREVDRIAATAAKSIAVTLDALDPTLPKSEIGKLNRVGNSVRLPLSRLTFRAVDLARHYSELTQGAFDFTAGELTELWEAGTPSPVEISRALLRTGARHIETSDNDTVAIKVPGLVIDPWRMAPAYALDVAVSDLRRTTRGPFLISFGQAARHDGRFAATNAPSLPLFAPNELTRRHLGDLRMSDHAAVVALPLPQKVILKAGAPRQVLIDPRTGRPAGGAALVVVAGPLAIKAHALAEALLVLGPDAGGEILASFEGYDVLILPDASAETGLATAGMLAMFEPTAQSPVLTLWPPASAPLPRPSSGEDGL
jgi:thiamine biosynthesis lipoprotein